MGVSKNNGTPKSSILTGFSIINHPFWGTLIFGNTHICIYPWSPSRPNFAPLGREIRLHGSASRLVFLFGRLPGHMTTKKTKAEQIVGWSSKLKTRGRSRSKFCQTCCGQFMNKNPHVTCVCSSRQESLNHLTPCFVCYVVVLWVQIVIYSLNPNPKPTNSVGSCPFGANFKISFQESNL